MLSAEEVQHVALLSRIGLKDEDVARYQKDLSAVLDFFQELEKLPTDKVAPIGHITGRANVRREDSMQPFTSAGENRLMENAPDTKDNFLKVRSVF